MKAETNFTSSIKSILEAGEKKKRILDQIRINYNVVFK